MWSNIEFYCKDCKGCVQGVGKHRRCCSKVTAQTFRPNGKNAKSGCRWFGSKLYNRFGSILNNLRKTSGFLVLAVSICPVQTFRNRSTISEMYGPVSGRVKYEWTSRWIFLNYKNDCGANCSFNSNMHFSGLSWRGRTAILNIMF